MRDHVPQLQVRTFTFSLHNSGDDKFYLFVLWLWILQLSLKSKALRRGREGERLGFVLCGCKRINLDTRGSWVRYVTRKADYRSLCPRRQLCYLLIPLTSWLVMWLDRRGTEYHKGTWFKSLRGRKRKKTRRKIQREGCGLLK